MNGSESKAPFDEWMRWAGVLQRRLGTIHDVYKQNGWEKDRELVNLALLRLRLILENEPPPPSAGESNSPYAAIQPHQLAVDLDKLDELRIKSLADIVRDALIHLPRLSTDMQKLLRSMWRGECSGRTASDLFKGPMNTKNEGIGSGKPEDGQLPMVLDHLLNREQAEGERPPRNRDVAPLELQRRYEVARRWAHYNASHMRSSGGIE